MCAVRDKGVEVGSLPGRALAGALVVLASFGATLMGAPRSAHAEDFGNTNLQLLYGANFKDRFLGTNTTSGKMGTATLEHFGAWAWGYNYFFVDFYQGNMADFIGQPTGTKARIYGEWSPSLSLRRITGHKGYGPIFRDIQLGLQLGRSGENFYANMAGGGVELALPSRYVISLFGYARYDNFNHTTYQGTLAWYLPYTLFGVGLLTAGFVDVNGTKKSGVEVIAQPQLLVDVGKFFGPVDTIYAGSEWYIHTNDVFTASVPQGMVRWNW